MKVMVTGGCGFLGSHVCEFYRKRGDQVVAFDNLTKLELKRNKYDSDLARNYNLEFLKSIGVEIVKGDLKNKQEVLDAAKGCDFIVHTGAQPAMTISIEDPELDLMTNVIGTFNVLEASRIYGIPMVFCSSIHVYTGALDKHLTEGETRYIRNPPEIDENEPALAGHLTPLHASKRSAEIYVQTYIDTYKIKAAVFRLTGMYGPRQFAGEDHGWVAHFAISNLTNKFVTIFGTGKQVRDILFASDAARAFHAFYEHQVPGIYNVGGGTATMISLIEVMQLIEKITGQKSQTRLEKERFGDLAYFVCNISKAKTQLHWKPEVLPEEGIRRMIAWIEENKNIFSEK